MCHLSGQEAAAKVAELRRFCRSMSALTSLFKRPDVKTQARAAQRNINNSARDIDREIAKLKRDEAELLKVGRPALCREGVRFVWRGTVPGHLALKVPPAAPAALSLPRQGCGDRSALLQEARQ